MKIAIISLITLLFLVNSSFAQNKIYSEDNGKIQGAYIDKVNFEESCLLKPPVPCMVDTLYVYLKGGAPCRDTIWLAMDPSDGLYPPTLYVLHYATYSQQIFQYTGEGWYKFNVSDKNINVGGYNRLSILHHINQNGPAIAYDNVPQGNSYNTIQSWMCDVYKPNPDFYNIAGTLTSKAGGHFLVRLSVRYQFDETKGSPEAVINDITQQSKLVDANNNVYLDAIASTSDWNNDGWDDLAYAGNFFENNKDGTYKNVTTQIGINGGQTVWGDIDNDGYIDCFVVGGGLNDKIYWGVDGKTFIENTDKTLQIDQPTVSPLLFDYNKDGLLDIYIAYGRKEVNGAETYYQDKLYKNLGNRKFENVTVSSGISKGEPSPFYDCWGASVCDFNNDGWIDIFVATYRLAPDLLYKNNGDGTFTEVGKQTGARGMPTQVEYYFGHGMGSDWGDYDNDGDYDLAVGNLGHPDSRGLVSNPSLILQNDNNIFTNVTNDKRLLFFEMNAGIVWLDLNNDSWLDLVHAEYSYNSKSSTPSPNHTRFYLNNGNPENLQLFDKTWEWGPSIHGAWCPIRLDYDNNGSMDVLVASSNESVKLFKNNLPEKGNWCEIRLEGDRASGMNSQAYGASVILETGNKKYIRNLPGSILNGRASQSTNTLHFGLAEAGKIDKITVKWNNLNNDITIINEPPVNLILRVSKNGILNKMDTAIISLNKSAVDFGVTNCNETKEEQIVIKNTGTKPLQIASAKILDDDKVFNFKTEFTPKTINPNEEITLNVIFKPIEKKNYIGKIILGNNALNSSVGNISLIGFGFKPSGEIKANLQQLDFDTVLVNESKEKTVTIQNTGEDVLTLKSASITSNLSNYFSINNALPISIPKNGTYDLKISFLPLSETLVKGTLIINSDAYILPKLEIPIIGFGEERKARISSSVEVVEFDSTKISDTTYKEIDIFNTGNKALEISACEVLMNKKNEFGILNYNPPYTINVNDKITLKLLFTAQKVGMASKSLEIRSNAIGRNKFIIPLKGIGYDPNNIDENSSKYSVSINPQPITDKAHLSFKLDLSTSNVPKNLFIFNIQGKLIANLDTKFDSNGEFSLYYDFSNYENGIYYISDDSRTFFYQFVINK